MPKMAGTPCMTSSRGRAVGRRHQRAYRYRLKANRPVPECELSFIPWLRIASGDIFTHGWDLAKATDQPTDLDPELAEMILGRMYVMLPDSMRGTDGKAPFGPKVDVPSSTPAADRLAGYLGRTP